MGTKENWFLFCGQCTKKLTSAKYQVTNAEAVNAIFTESKACAWVQAHQIILITKITCSTVVLP